MRTTDGAVGFCNLQCWCHVPIRGVNKPPCYLCVIETCSLSCKQSVTPSAPDITPTEVSLPPSNLPSVAETTSGLDPSSARRYGWRLSIARNASVSFSQRSESSSGSFEEMYVRLPPEGAMEFARIGGEIPEQESLSNNRSVSEQRHVATVASHEYGSETGATHVDSRVTVTHSLDGDGHNVTVIAVNDDDSVPRRSSIDCGSMRTADISELLKRLVCDTDQVTFSEDNKEESQTRVLHRASLAGSSEQRASHSNHHQTLSSSFAVTSHSNARSRLDPEEAKYQRIHKIHRRDSSMDAAARYLQSDEHLHRMWFRELSSRRRNHPGRAFRSRSFESESTSDRYESEWQNLEKLLGKDNIW